MAYSEELANRVREELALTRVQDVGEIKMYGGLAFMVNGKMCVCVGGSDPDNVMVRVGKDLYDDALKQNGAMPMIMKDRPIKGYIDVSEEGQKDLKTWVELALKFNEELISQEK